MADYSDFNREELEEELAGLKAELALAEKNVEQIKKDIFLVEILLAR